MSNATDSLRSAAGELYFGIKSDAAIFLNDLADRLDQFEAEVYAPEVRAKDSFADRNEVADNRERSEAAFGLTAWMNGDGE